MATRTSLNLYSPTISRLEELINQLDKCSTIYEKLIILEERKEVISFIGTKPFLKEGLADLNPYEKAALLSLFALEQGPTLFATVENERVFKEFLPPLLRMLLDLEKFYDSIGGIIGYHLTILKLLQVGCADKETKFLKPVGLSLSTEIEEMQKAIASGVQALPKLSAIFPVGGAGDRLNLQHSRSEEPLPAARLQFLGQSLIEGLIRILQGWEYLYYKLNGKQLTIPVVLMTSHEKKNSEHVASILEEERWFGRAQKSFFTFTQPLVPMLTKEGNWACTAPLRPVLKPGGHGALWKLCLDSGAFTWLEKQEKEEVLVLQINNPLVGLDGNLLALVGTGHQGKKEFGFLGCERLPGVAEGMIVLKEEKEMGEYRYSLTNVEYTEFEKQGVSEKNALEFPANPNVLYGRISALKKLSKKHPIPGKLINLKNKAPCLDPKGNRFEAAACRLESTMQNLADEIAVVSSKKKKANELIKFPTAFVQSARNKTLSVTKKSYVPGEKIKETPQGAFYDLQSAHGELLKEACLIQVPSLGSEEEYLTKGPGYIFNYHPALGPLWEIIGQKIRGGVIHEGSELQLEIAEVDISRLDLKGSLLIHSDATLGEKNSNEVIVYSETSSRCELHEVKVRNQGIDLAHPNVFWKNQIRRTESLQINLHGNSEFFAYGVTFEGDQKIEVPDSHRLIVEMEGDKVVYRLEKITSPTWHWGYTVDGKGEVLLERVSKKD